ncbi:MAG TPA: hypothetical protein VJN69_03630 [Candidatus Acidoferrales bacterium]|nr:hypothetical protein [Candidatus Acidoferrales bacterium]
MKTFTFLLVLFTSVAAFAGEPPLAAQAATPVAGTYFVCTLSASAAGVLTYYVSDVNGPFDFKSAGPALDELSHAFQNFLTAKYHTVGGSVSCVYQYSQADAEALKKRDLTTGYTGYTHVDTGWKNGQTAAATSSPAPSAAAPAASAGSGTPYYCYSYYKFPGTARQTDYTTGVFTLTASYGWTRLWWSAYVHRTYHIPVDAKPFDVDCSQLPTAADKQQQVLSSNVTRWRERNEDVVQVSWKPNQTAPVGAAEPSVKEMLSGQVRPQDHAPIGSPPTNAGAALNGAPSSQGTGAGQWVVCYSDVSQSSFYLSSGFHIDVPKPRVGPEADPSSVAANARAIGELKTAFLAYIQKQYGYHSSSAYPVECQGGAGEGDLAGARDLLHSRFPQLKFIETGWKPGMSATADKPSAAKPATPPPSAAQTAYEKALAAQQPAASSASQVDAAGFPISGSPAATNTNGQKYSYCYTIGNLPHAPSAAARSNYYVSPVFAAGSASAAASAFQKMLEAANPQVKIQAATCTAPQSMAATQTLRNNEIAARKNNPYITTVEVNWKP